MQIRESKYGEVKPSPTQDVRQLNKTQADFKLLVIQVGTTLCKLVVLGLKQVSFRTMVGMPWVAIKGSEILSYDNVVSLFTPKRLLQIILTLMDYRTSHHLIVK